eukprot:8420565-Pyramimonas_sp.AAC.1
MLRGAVSFLHLIRAVGGCRASNHRNRFRTSDASVCGMQSSDLGVILELGLSNYFVLFESSREMLSIYIRNSGCMRAIARTEENLEA